MSILKLILGDPNKKLIDKVQPIINRINELEQKYSQMSDEELKNQTSILKEKINSSEDKDKALDEILPDAFAVAREAGKRVLGMRHFDVQLIAGYFLHKGYVSEMRTGEGKTLVATLPAYLNALTGNGVHVITVNDYLAKRDSEWMGRLYSFLGISTSFVGHMTSLKLSYITKEDGSINLEFVPVSRKEAYACDITYGTNNEFGFDYLRDNMVVDLNDKTQRKLNYAIVDEVDSILIDEARTPLIISSEAAQSAQMYYSFAQIVGGLQDKTDYVIDEKLKSATLTDAGLKKVESTLGVSNIYTNDGIAMVHHLEEALKAKALFLRDRDYVVKDGEIIIVDEFTGRMMPGRRYSEGLHQAIEAKENVEIKNESMTLATITLQNYFRIYKKLSGMTGTAITEAEEFGKIYKLEVVVVPTNKPNVRKDLNDKIYKNEHGKFVAVVEEIKKKYEIGQPVLVGTVSIEKNEILSNMLNKAGIPHNVLNAKNHEREAEIIAQAGKFRAVTIATNMAGRGVDIKLGGSEDDVEESTKIKELGGLCVIGTERHESRRIDNQLRGRAGRQGDPGSTQFFISLEDDLMRIFGSEKIGVMMEGMGIPEDMPIENGMISKSIESAQKRVEGHNFDIRKHLVEYDDVINSHRNIIYKKRDEILENADKSRETVVGFINEEISKIVNVHTAEEDYKKWNVDAIYQSINSMFVSTADLKNEIQLILDQNNITPENKKKELIERLFKFAESSYRDLENEITPEFLRQIEKQMLLKIIDNLWISHLDTVSDLRMSVGLRGYGQRDPLVEYKRDAFNMFTGLIDNIKTQIAYSIFKVRLITNVENPQAQDPSLLNKAQEAGADEPEQFSNAIDEEKVENFLGLNNDDVRKKMEAEVSKNDHAEFNGVKVGRNDLCPCGSGKKYKKCHGKE